MTENPKLSFDDQLLWLKNHGVLIENSDQCENYLKRKNYFYKLIGYIKRFNFDDQIIINNFDKLVDISILDMELRYCLLPLCLDIEHWIKTYILRIITNDPTEDGYNIVQNVINSDINPDDFKRKLFSSVSFYDEGQCFKVQPEYQGFYDNPPIWIILEIASIGKLRSFIEYMSKKRPGNKDLRQINGSIKYINRLRNSCAHNREILTKDIFENNNQRIPHNIFSSLRRDRVLQQQIYKPLLLKIALTLKIHKKICSQESHLHRINDLKRWVERTKISKKFYEDDDPFNIFFDDIENLLNIYE